jgi:hypothetical protein
VKNDIITNVQDQIDRAAQLLKRNDLNLCVQLTPGKRPRFAIRLGERPWIKDIDLPDTLTMITQQPEEAAKNAARLALTADTSKKLLTIYGDLTLWKEEPPTEPAF